MSSLADLSKNSVVILSGSWFEKDLKAAGLKINLAPSMENAIKRLQAGRADFLVEEQTVGYDAIKTVFPADVESFQVLPNNFFPSGGSYLMVSRTYPNSKELLAKFNSGLKTIRSNGVFDALAVKYKLSK